MGDPASMVDLHYEDIVVGDGVETQAHTITMDDILGFAAVTRDHHPLHVDPDYCSRTEFGRPIAHGLYGLALIEGLKSELKLYENTSIASLGWDKVSFRAPAFVGDRVHVRMRFLAKRPSRDPARGIVTEGVELLNQDGRVVVAGEHVTMVKCRAAAS
ncbi:acyl dehydratase [Stella humosa]|uniref:Acyl dehydratase n=1 Tax=Stella humosa TaxID=94 RepID=A0A3N1KRM5_9PROT|nr:MaoC/PaaZ C-terminal domain-containing protein [Stella humosa]ROP81439.1 acyl dehydratase [Stella humosa]BBK32791.1 monoamine oxidase [Stella humosa]